MASRGSFAISRRYSAETDRYVERERWKRKKRVFFRNRRKERGGKKMKRNRLIEASTMFNSTKPKTRPANYGTNLAIDPEEKNLDVTLVARDTLSPSFVFSQIPLHGNCFFHSAAKASLYELLANDRIGEMTSHQWTGKPLIRDLCFRIVDAITVLALTQRTALSSSGTFKSQNRIWLGRTRDSAIRV